MGLISDGEILVMESNHGVPIFRINMAVWGSENLDHLDKFIIKQKQKSARLKKLRPDTLISKNPRKILSAF